VIILEDALGLDEQTNTYVVGATYRFNQRHSLGLSATDLRRTASRVIDDEIEWGDYVYRANATVSSELDMRIYKLTYRYDFSESDRLNAGFLAGLSTFDIGLTLSGEARLEGDTGEEWVEGVSEGADVIAPVPVVGFFLDYALSARWITRFQADLIDLSVGDSRGRVIETEFSIEHSITDLFALGLGLGGSDVEYRSDEGDEKLGVTYRFNTVGVFAVFTF